MKARIGHIRRLSIAAGLASALALGLAAGLPGAALAHTTELKAKFAQGTRFIELLHQVPDADILPTQSDLNLRFGSGIVAYGAQDVRVLKDRALQGHINRVNRIIDGLLAAYTEGPKPAHIPFVIVSSNDVNCAVTPVAPEQYKSHVTRMAQMASGSKAFSLDDAKNHSDDGKTGDDKTGPGADHAIPEATPIAMEMRCSRLFLEQVTSDDEMAFVLAHELSHILLGHWKAGDAEIRQQVQTQKTLETGLGLIAATQNLQGNSGGLLQAANPKYFGEAKTKLSSATFMLNEYNIVIRGPSWQREQERDADILALDLLYKAGFSRAGSWQILTKAAEAQKALDAKSNYVESLVKSAAAQMVLGVSPDQFSMMSTVRSTVTSVGASVYGHFRDAQVQKVHDNAEVRTKAVVEYENQHPVASKASAAEEDFFGGNSFARAAAPIGRADDFISAIQDSSCENLSPELTAALNTMLRSKARTQSESQALYIYYDCKGNDARAVVYAAEAAAGPSKTSDYYTNYILALIKVKQYARADAVIAAAARTAPPYDQYVFLDIEVKMALKQKARAVRIAEACYVALRWSNAGAANHCLELAQIDNKGRAVEPEAPPPQIETNKGVVAGATSVANYSIDRAKHRAKSIVKGAKDFLGVDDKKDDAAASETAPPPPPPVKKKKHRGR